MIDIVLKSDFGKNGNLIFMQEELKRAIEALRHGELALFPSDVGWLIGADATDDKAVERLLCLCVPPGLGMATILFDNPGKVQNYLDEMPDIAWDLMEMSEKPLTIVYSGGRNIAPALLAGNQKRVAIRVTTESFAKNLCARFRKPIVSIPAGNDVESAPIEFCDINETLKLKVDYVVDYRRADKLENDLSVIQLGKGNLFKLIRE